MPLEGPMIGHYWTIRPWLSHVLSPRPAPIEVPWSVEVPDDRLGRVRLRGRLREHAGARDAVVVVHGLGGSIDSQYMIAAAIEAERAGLTCLRMNLRGAPGDGEDIYNAGLAQDLGAAVASPELARYEAVYLLGYSLGGQLSLLHATSAPSARLRAVAAVCPPLDLDRTVEALDQPSRWTYRKNVLDGLKSGLPPVRARHPELHVPTPDEVRGIRRLRTWDDRVVAPRFGFRSAEHYYAEVSVGPRLANLARPALLVAATHDPMIPAATVTPFLEAEHPLLDVRWIEGAGHVGFPPTLDLGLGGEAGLETQAIRWLRRAASL